MRHEFQCCARGAARSSVCGIGRQASGLVKAACGLCGVVNGMGEYGYICKEEAR